MLTKRRLIVAGIVAMLGYYVVLGSGVTSTMASTVGGWDSGGRCVKQWYAWEQGVSGIASITIKFGIQVQGGPGDRAIGAWETVTQTTSHAYPRGFSFENGSFGIYLQPADERVAFDLFMNPGSTDASCFIVSSVVIITNPTGTGVSSGSPSPSPSVSPTPGGSAPGAGCVANPGSAPLPLTANGTYFIDLTMVHEARCHLMWGRNSSSSTLLFATSGFVRAEMGWDGDGNCATAHCESARTYFWRPATNTLTELGGGCTSTVSGGANPNPGTCDIGARTGTGSGGNLDDVYLDVQYSNLKGSGTRRIYGTVTVQFSNPITVQPTVSPTPSLLTPCPTSESSCPTNAPGTCYVLTGGGPLPIPCSTPLQTAAGGTGPPSYPPTPTPDYQTQAPGNPGGFVNICLPNTTISACASWPPTPGPIGVTICPTAGPSFSPDPIEACATPPPSMGALPSGYASPAPIGSPNPTGMAGLMSALGSHEPFGAVAEVTEVLTDATSPSSAAGGDLDTCFDLPWWNASEGETANSVCLPLDDYAAMLSPLRWVLLAMLLIGIARVVLERIAENANAG